MGDPGRLEEGGARGAPLSINPKPAKDQATAVPNPSTMQTAAKQGDQDLPVTIPEEKHLRETQELTADVMKYRVENGRTYHGFKEHLRYVLPNDESEKRRLDVQHYLTYLTLEGRLYLCPAGRDRPIRTCLDAGTGTGSWALEFAQEHPDTEVIGIDISPIQPEYVPPNVCFQIDDVEDDWNYDEPFDFIFCRMLTGAIADWTRFFKQSFANLEPGGWCEVQDIVAPIQCSDGTLDPDSPLATWSRDLLRATQLAGRGIDGAKLYKRQMEEAGFVNVKEEIFIWPQCPWADDDYYRMLGRWADVAITGGLESLSTALFTRHLGWKKAELDVYLTQVRKQMRDRGVHAYWTIYMVYGQKPE
ncbi:S-adenosyl-L-methionine-dependent methyltransferase [Emericellopsis atlantica]|uniref:S-adenosyl-L-methionine-dependent methyltransferase n=1 Tax=Emericellopsis atlantica TaxID=2614577 RepID=A0A9P8CM39_9HYPO|nr:S-adenosyl-L-methionine-dependent methyltransferase [Emericellopsis atlantica]KAG9250261.1 S-adenosyl-L-methionine-dependent methyltransferase [Emericellopsis atlantica]